MSEISHPWDEKVENVSRTIFEMGISYIVLGLCLFVAWELYKRYAMQSGEDVVIPLTTMNGHKDVEGEVIRKADPVEETTE